MDIETLATIVCCGVVGFLFTLLCIGMWKSID